MEILPSSGHIGCPYTSSAAGAAAAAATSGLSPRPGIAGGFAKAGRCRFSVALPGRFGELLCSSLKHVTMSSAVGRSTGFELQHWCQRVDTSSGHSSGTLHRHISFQQLEWTAR